MGAELISIIGPPGSGKTTLAEFIHRRLDARIIYEDYQGNIFLADSYEGQVRSVLAAQLYFLFSRVKQLACDTFGESGIVVSDYGFCQDRIYAQSKLSRDDLKIYESLAGNIEWKVKPPSLIIHLDAPLDELKRRISARGRDFEKAFSDDFLCDIRSAYTDIEKRLGCPVISIDTAARDIRNDDEREKLISEILEIIK